MHAFVLRPVVSSLVVSQGMVLLALSCDIQPQLRSL
jgi:hypothetical protein